VALAQALPVGAHVGGVTFRVDVTCDGVAVPPSPPRRGQHAVDIETVGDGRRVESLGARLGDQRPGGRSRQDRGDGGGGPALAGRWVDTSTVELGGDLGIGVAGCSEAGDEAGDGIDEAAGWVQRIVGTWAGVVRILGSGPAATGGRARYGDEHWRAVAAVYTEAYRRGDFPKAAVADRFDVARNTATQWVHRARKRGFLPPTAERKARA
jgi:hypothetical protein